MPVTALHTHPRARLDVDAQADAVLAALQTESYASVAASFGTSRGKVYSLALKAGARKHEQRIAERQAEKRQRQREFLQEVLDATATADVLDFLAGLPDDTVDLFVSSPPYNLGVPYGGSRGSDSHRFHYYLGWLLQVTSEMARTLKPGGTLFLQVGATRDTHGNLYPIDCMLFEHLRGMGLTFQSRVVWTIAHGLTPKRRLAERHEVALVFSKGEQAVFNPTPARTPQRDPGKRAFKGPRKGELSGHPLGAHPTNVWNIAPAGHNRPGYEPGHPAQFPAELARRAILLYSQPGHLVVDPFMGSGTVAAEAVRTGRHFSGCDLHYDDVRAARLAKVAPDLVSPLPGISDEAVAVWAAEARPVHRVADAEQAALFDAAGPST